MTPPSSLLTPHSSLAHRDARLAAEIRRNARPYLQRALERNRHPSPDVEHFTFGDLHGYEYDEEDRHYPNFELRGEE